MDGIATLAGIVGAVLGSLATAATAFVAAWAIWRRLSHKVRLESDASALSHYEGVIGHLNAEIERQQEQADRCEQHIDRQALHIKEQADGLEQMRREHVRCREQIGVLRGYVERLYDAARRLARACHKDPDDHDVLPPLPHWPEDDRSASEFRSRTLQQNTRNLTELGRDAPPPAEG